MADVRRVLWVSLAVVGLLVIGAVAGYLWQLGLDRADKVASGIGALAGLASLLLGAVQLVRNDHAQASAQRATVNDSAQRTTVNIVGGDNQGQLIQADTVRGNLGKRRRG